MPSGRTPRKPVAPKETPPEAEDGQRGFARATLGSVLNSEKIAGQLEALIDEAMSQTTTAGAECEKCGHQTKVVVRDVKKVADTMIALLEQYEGRASQAQPDTTEIIIERAAL